MFSRDPDLGIEVPCGHEKMILVLMINSGPFKTLLNDNGNPIMSKINHKTLTLTSTSTIQVQLILACNVVSLLQHFIVHCL